MLVPACHSPDCMKLTFIGLTILKNLELATTTYLQLMEGNLESASDVKHITGSFGEVFGSRERMYTTP